MGYMATIFRFSPPGENNMASTMKEISDRVGAQNNHLTQVRDNNINNFMIHIHLW